jgi:excisionase family DNA binding protein
MVEGNTGARKAGMVREEQRLAVEGRDRIARLMRRQDRHPEGGAGVPNLGIVIHGPERDEEVPLPAAVARVVVEAMEQVARGYSVAVVPLEKELTSTQVARLLNVSRPYAARLMDGGEIPSHRVGTHRRAFYADVMAYKRRMDRDADDALRRMTELTEELGLYEK